MPIMVEQVKLASGVYATPLQRPVNPSTLYNISPPFFKMAPSSDFETRFALSADRCRAGSQLSQPKSISNPAKCSKFRLIFYPKSIGVSQSHINSVYKELTEVLFLMRCQAFELWNNAKTTTGCEKVILFASAGSVSQASDEALVDFIGTQNKNIGAQIFSYELAYSDVTSPAGSVAKQIACANSGMHTVDAVDVAVAVAIDVAIVIVAETPAPTQPIQYAANDHVITQCNRICNCNFKCTVRVHRMVPVLRCVARLFRHYLAQGRDVCVLRCAGGQSRPQANELPTCVVERAVRRRPRDRAYNVGMRACIQQEGVAATCDGGVLRGIQLGASDVSHGMACGVAGYRGWESAVPARCPTLEALYCYFHTAPS